MAKKKDSQFQVSITVVIGSLVVLFLLGIFVGLYVADKYSVPAELQKTMYKDSAGINGQSQDIIKEYITTDGKSTFASIAVPAVDDQGNGVVTFLDVQASPGSGRILTNIDKLFFWVDTQNSIRKATKVAEDITGKDMSKYDIVYTVKANASIIEGGSAGAALAIATIAALENKTIDKKVMVTGTVEEDGRVGPIGEVVAKAIGAKEAGATLFLVPSGQGSSKIYRPERKCYSEAGFQICETRTIAEKIYITKDVGIEVKEVKNIREALQYFFGSSN